MAGMQNQQQAKEQQQAQEEARKKLLHSLIDTEARARLGRIALVDPAKARSIEDRIIVLAQQGNIGTVTDAQVKAILEGMDTAAHTTVTIKRTKNFDDDDDDIDDDF
ncbi:double-stranded DNA-binding family protein [Blastocystis sp. ATCC 50177/Nand II]|uniref:Double-stranded DNA-binding family protein n=1 Tax=Blastocystis sp. subtype 1 (strain ATCC 50177 / NandII) TaxID=478820 RepID=A0A196SDI4_BLAHN|nr:double-stranded DNA-binding family protein [Blastocystis sp. ATCC 50177/Nand II]